MHHIAPRHDLVKLHRGLKRASNNHEGEHYKLTYLNKKITPDSPDKTPWSVSFWFENHHRYQPRLTPHYPFQVWGTWNRELCSSSPGTCLRCSLRPAHSQSIFLRRGIVRSGWTSNLCQGARSWRVSSAWARLLLRCKLWWERRTLQEWGRATVNVRIVRSWCCVSWTAGKRLVHPQLLLLVASARIWNLSGCENDCCVRSSENGSYVDSGPKTIVPPHPYRR